MESLIVSSIFHPVRSRFEAALKKSVILVETLCGCNKIFDLTSKVTLPTNQAESKVNFDPTLLSQIATSKLTFLRILFFETCAVN